MKRSPRRRFAYQLAVRLGRVNVDAMLRYITAKQFAEWEAYAQLDPFDELRADSRAALIAQVLANIHRGKGQRAYMLKDFLLKFGELEKVRRQTPEEQFNILKLLARVQAMQVK